ncbi:hypothetical protein ABT127_18470 [Streptomyces sp. NPDC001904]|uniref:hypothetical protein n=1 Tax=Streptomyces sp. NPDC001904 TaxID=3154531 RepID=UPI00332516D8
MTTTPRTSAIGPDFTIPVEKRYFEDCVPGATYRYGSIAGLAPPGIDTLRWTRPVRPGDRLSIRTTVRAARLSRTKPDRGIVHTDVEVLNQHDDTVLTLTALNLLRSRDAGRPAPQERRNHARNVPAQLRPTTPHQPLPCARVPDAVPDPAMSCGARLSRGATGLGSTGWSTGAGPEVDRRRHGGSDVVGIVVLGGCAAWSMITATARAGRPEGVLLAVLAVAAGYAGGRIAGGLAPVATSCAVGAGGLCLALAAPQAVPAPNTSTPLGGAGATAALLVLSTGALACAAWAARTRHLRVTLHLLSAGTVVLGAVAGSGVGAAASCGVVLCTLAAAGLRHRAGALAGLGVGTAAVAGLGLALAGGALPSGAASFLGGELPEGRVRLWHRALDLAASDPVLGAGPGRFEEFGPVTTVSAASAGSPAPDARPHSAVLQVAAEQGFIGLALLTAAYCWLLYVLWRSTRPTPVVLTAGAALTAVAVLATVGNALSFTAVTAGAGLLAGIATAMPLGDEPPDDDAAAPEPVRDGRG